MSEYIEVSMNRLGQLLVSLLHIALFLDLPTNSETTKYGNQWELRYGKEASDEWNRIGTTFNCHRI